MPKVTIRRERREDAVQLRQLLNTRIAGDRPTEREQLRQLREGLTLTSASDIFEPPTIRHVGSPFASGLPDDDHPTAVAKIGFKCKEHCVLAQKQPKEYRSLEAIARREHKPPCLSGCVQVQCCQHPGVLGQQGDRVEITPLEIVVVCEVFGRDEKTADISAVQVERDGPRRSDNAFDLLENHLLPGFRVVALALGALRHESLAALHAVPEQFDELGHEVGVSFPCQCIPSSFTSSGRMAQRANRWNSASFRYCQLSDVDRATLSSSSRNSGRRQIGHRTTVELELVGDTKRMKGEVEQRLAERALQSVADRINAGRRA